MPTSPLKPHLIILKSNGDCTSEGLSKPPDLAKLQSAVAGHIELVPAFDRYMSMPCVVFCNEEGKLHGLPMNVIATRAWMQCNGGGPLNDVLVGDIAIICGPKSFLERL